MTVYSQLIQKNAKDTCHIHKLIVHTGFYSTDIKEKLATSVSKTSTLTTVKKTKHIKLKVKNKIIYTCLLH